VLHSLSGTMAISETVLKDTVLMAIDEINARAACSARSSSRGRRSGLELAAVRREGKQLIGQDKVVVTFGCWTSVSRKSVLPVYEEMNSLLFYPVQYEGEELSKNVFYTGAAPNQQAIPAVEYLMSKAGGGAKRWVLLGTDYVYRAHQQDPARLPEQQGCEGFRHRREVHAVRPQRLPDHRRRHQEVRGRRQDRGGSTINGDSNVPFYKELGNAGLRPRTCGGGVLGRRRRAARRRHKPLVGHLRRGTTSSRSSPRPTPSSSRSGAPTPRPRASRHKDKPLTNDPMEATYIASTCGRRRSRRPAAPTPTR